MNEIPTNLLYNPKELEEWLDQNTCAPLTSDELDEMSAMWEDKNSISVDPF